MISLTPADSQKGLKFRNRFFSVEALDYVGSFLLVIQDKQSYILKNLSVSDLLVCNKSLSVIYFIVCFFIPLVLEYLKSNLIVGWRLLSFLMNSCTCTTVPFQRKNTRFFISIVFLFFQPRFSVTKLFHNLSFRCCLGVF